MKTFFTSDTHFAHVGVLQMSARPFASIEEHDDALIYAINRTVGERDRLYHLGDFAWFGEESFFSRIKCRNVHLIIGNHDRGRAIKLFKSAADVGTVTIGEHKVFLSHYPHAYWPASHHGALHLYGHQHGQREATLDACFPGRRSMDVGVDEAKRLLGEYRPFSEDEILEILLPRPGHDPVEWYRDYQAARDRKSPLTKETCQDDLSPVGETCPGCGGEGTISHGPAAKCSWGHHTDYNRICRHCGLSKREIVARKGQ